MIRDGVVTMRYSVHFTDGSSMTMGLTGLTPDQVALVQWLQAEKAWHRSVVEDERRREKQREEAAEQSRTANERLRVKRAHNKLVNGATGFHEAALIRHAPVKLRRSDDLVCASCISREYEPDRVAFPCDEYLFARDWGQGK